MRNHLLTVKLYAPPLRQDLVPRSRLLRKLDAGRQQGSLLSLISAPAGYGKTTLVLEWLQLLERPASWLSLDRGDNDPGLFLAYLIAALQQVHESIGRAQLAALANAEPSDVRGAWLQEQMTLLINELAVVEAPFMLVLDDYHVINDLAIHEALAFLLEHQPRSMHLVITTRQDPLLPLPRLRSQGRLTEVRLGDLRFTTDEAARFLGETMGLDLSPQQIADLASRTEGWIAGLQLAALSLTRPMPTDMPTAAPEPYEMRGNSPTAETFGGDDRHVVDYLMDEVLSRQSLRIQRFLLQTSILKRLCAPLCDAILDVTKPADDSIALSADPLSSNQKLLEELEQKNVFIIPLDNRRHWYRYHHLFADLLHSRLHALDPGRVRDLHRRAGRWFEQEGLVEEAVEHALLAEDIDGAVRLIDQAARTAIWRSGDLPTLLNWLKRLPEQALLSRPGLCLYYARGLFFAGQVGAAERYLQTATRALVGAPCEAPLRVVALTNQATFAAMRGDSEQALQRVDQARDRLPIADDSTQARLAHAQGMAHYFRGEPAAAANAFAGATIWAQKAGNQILGLDVISCHALSLLMAGRLHEAEQLCVDALAMSKGGSQPPAAGAVYLALAQVYYERYERQRARAAVQSSVELARKANWLHVLWQAYTLQAHIMHALHDEEESRQALRQAQSVAERYPLCPVRRLVDACAAELAVSGADAARAASWAQALHARHGDGSPEEPCPLLVAEQERLALARVLLALEEPDAALATLEALLSAARVRTTIETLALQALSLQALGRKQSAVQALQHALALAAPAALSRPFLQLRGIPGGPQTMSVLLNEVRQDRNEAPVMRFAWELLCALEAEGVAAPQRLPATPELVEQLSERELEVLALIAGGLSNPQVAERLYLSPNTVRVHTSNIYAKLAVHNRVAAVARAQELGLLPES